MLTGILPYCIIAPASGATGVIEGGLNSLDSCEKDEIQEKNRKIISKFLMDDVFIKRIFRQDIIMSFLC